MEAIIVQLKGPMVSWGKWAIGDNRDTYPHPTASALMGLLGACCGIDRRQPDLVSAWYDAWDVVSLTTQARQPSAPQPERLYDFHTAQNTLLANGDTNASPVVGYHGFLMDSASVAALVPRRDAPALLALAERGLQEPVYTPSLGRLCNPLAIAPWAGRATFSAIEELLRRLKEQLKQLDPAVCRALSVVPASLVGNPPANGTDVLKSLTDERRGGRRFFGERLCWMQEVEWDE